MALFPPVEINQDFKDFLDENHVYPQYMDEDELHILKFLFDCENLEFHNISDECVMDDFNKDLFKKTKKEYCENIIFKPTSREELDEAKDLWFENKDKAIMKFNHISKWDTSLINDMSKLFCFRKNFNEDISNWNVSNVTNMDMMFSDCHKFNQPLNNWNVSNVTNMDMMFYDCHKFNQPLNDWNVGNVTTMVAMFGECKNFNQPLNNWNVSNVTNMCEMFDECKTFNQPLNDWDVSNVEDMSYMFEGCKNLNQSFRNWNWNISNFTKTEKMFGNCYFM